MREILFRGIDIATGEMVIGQGINMAYDTPRLFIGLNAHTVDRKTVGQFTGLTDCNGVKIFEGDIISIDFDFGYGLCSVNATVIWKDAGWKFDSEAGCTYGDDGVWKVIGNIHQNPELLERTHG